MPPLPPYFQAGEGFDCGEAIHLSGVNHSIVANNVVDDNAGGILISDDIGPNHDNLISATPCRTTRTIAALRLHPTTLRFLVRTREPILRSAFITTAS